MAGNENLVLDTSFLVALARDDDVHHESARAVGRRMAAVEWDTFLVPEYVFAETVTVLSARLGMGEAREWGSALLRAHDVQIVPAFDQLVPTWALFRDQPTARLSLADCAVIVTALRHGTREVATFDRALGEVEGIVMVGP